MSLFTFFADWQVSTPITKGLQSLSELILKLTSAQKLGKAIRFRANHNFSKATSTDWKIQADRPLAARPARIVHPAQESLDSRESNSPKLADDVDLRTHTQKMTHDIKPNDITPQELYDVDPYVCFQFFLLGWVVC